MLQEMKGLGSCGGRGRQGGQGAAAQGAAKALDKCSSPGTGTWAESHSLLCFHQGKPQLPPELTEKTGSL